MAEYFLLIIVVLTIGWLGITVLKANPKRLHNLYFFLLVLSLEVWIISNFLEAEVQSSKLLIFLFRLDFASAAWASYFFLRLCLKFPRESKEFVPNRLVFYIVLLMSIASFTPYVVKTAMQASSKLQPVFQTGSLFWVYMPLVAGNVFFAVVAMWRKSKVLTGLEKVQADFVLLGMGIVGILTVTINLGIAPFFRIPKLISRLGVYSILWLAVFTSYSILRYRMMDMWILLRESTNYFLTAGAIGILASFVMVIFTNDFNLGGLVFLLCLLVPYVQKKLSIWLGEQKLRRGLVDPKKSKNIQSIGDRIKDAGYRISDLANTVVDIIMDEFPVKISSFYIMNYDTRNFVFEAGRGLGNKFVLPISAEDPLIRYLQKHRETLVNSETKRLLTEPEFESIQNTLEKIDADVCEPLVVLDQVAGFIAIGEKTNKKPFFTNEIRHLKTISNEAATALRYVLAQSRSAKETIKWAHELNQSLKPLTIGYQLLIRRAAQNGMDPNLENTVPRIERTLKKLGEFLRFLTYESRIIDEFLRDKYELVPLNIEEVITKGISMHVITINSKRIKLDQQLSNLGNIEICGYQRDLISVFEILASNAIRYTPDGGTIKILGKRSNGFYRIEFTNEGPQIPEHYFEDIFKERFQIKNGSEGMGGLGLTNAKRIIDMHKGRISVKNSSDPAGVTFNIELPSKAK